MNKLTLRKKVTATSVAVTCMWVSPLMAQGELTEPEIEEVVVVGRFINASEKLASERMNDAFATDLLGADLISRLGDSTVASALRRVPGLTLVQDKFVYIRGLGERFSHSTLNGANIPSPDLTRNVIPLDVFPTSVVESLRVQKSWSPAMSANFGGGAIDIRTRGIPDSLTFKFEVGLGENSETPGNAIHYAGGSDDRLGTDDGSRALPVSVTQALANYQGNPSVNSILGYMQGQDPTATLYDAQLANRELAASLNRNIGIVEKSTNPDYDARVSFGNKFDLGREWQAGFNVGASYGTDWRFRRTTTANFGLPEEQNGVREESTQSVNITGTLNLGLGFTEDHEIATTTLLLRNTDDETEVFDFFNENRPLPSGRGFRDYRLQFEEREMVTNLVRGTHYLGSATREKLPFLAGVLSRVPNETHIDWFYSVSKAETDIPNQVTVASETFTDPTNGSVQSEFVRLTSSAADFRFTDLHDEVDHYGWSAHVPFALGNSELELSGGYDHARKARIYRQTQLSLGFLGVNDQSVLEGGLNDVFSDDHIFASIPDPANPVPGSHVFLNNVVFDRQGTNSNSYLAATMTDSIWGQADFNWKDSWRFTVGARWEDYRQAAVDWNPYGFSETDPQVTTDVDILRNGTFNDDSVYPSAGITYTGDLWAETFQLRLGYSQTSVRPDLREITDSSYIDPITGDLVRGNPGIVPSDMDNIDLRAEWYFGNGDTLSVTLFNKEIDNPIEFFEIPASDTTIAREIVNAESASITGVEIEVLKELAFAGGIFETMFIQGNLTLQDAELVAGPNANVPTNPVRNLSGASDYVVNLMLGFDSPDAKHSASLIYNVFDERLYVAGRNGAPDGFEQPFQSLDLTYFWYPTERITMKAKVQNLLGETIAIERAGVVTFEEDPGTLISLGFSWAL